MTHKKPASPFSPRAFLPLTMVSIEIWGLVAATCCCSLAAATHFGSEFSGQGARIVSCFDVPTNPGASAVLQCQSRLRA